MSAPYLLRDYFAAQVFPTVWDVLHRQLNDSNATLEGATTYEVAAKAAYEMADAMLKARDV